jgi:hypothetical protein
MAMGKEQIMNVELVKVSRCEAVKQHQAYREALRTHRESYLRDLSRAYWHLKRGRGIIDVLAAIRQLGVNEEGEPKLAIAPANIRRIAFAKFDPGTGQFQIPNTRRLVFDIPNNVFPAWQRTKTQWPEIIRQRIETNVPIVPAHLLPRGSLSRYFVLWEVEQWERVAPRDPILLKRINRNLFAVFATWDLTPLERALVHGR